MWLALRLGCPHVDDVLDSLSPEEFREWLAYWMINGEGRRWRSHAEVLAELHNLPVRYGEMKAGKPFPGAKVNANDVLPKLFQPEESPDSGDEETEQQRLVETLAKHLGCI